MSTWAFGGRKATSETQTLKASHDPGPPGVAVWTHGVKALMGFKNSLGGKEAV